MALASTDPSLALLRPVLQAQTGVVSREQAIGAGLQHHDLRRLERRRLLVRVLPRVYVDHTGVPTWVQRAWAAVQYAWPAVLVAESAMRAADGPGRPGAEAGPITVGISRERRVSSLPGVRVVRTFDLDSRARWNLGPPRLPYDEAALDVALGARDDFSALGAVARAVQSQHTTAARMRTVLDGRRRAARRDFLSGVLADVAAGTCSVLEHGYLERVERPHGLPAAVRQLREVTASGVVYRDGALGGFYLELDGRLVHDTAEQRDRDFERDLDASVAGRGTVRLSWGQVYDRPCSTAAKLAVLLARHGRRPVGRPCSAQCAVADVA